MPPENSQYPPIIFLAFANDQEVGEKYLRNLPAELKAIRKALAGAEQAGLCKIIERANLTIDEVFDVFQENQNEIAIFHFGGHANSYELLLESDDRKKNTASSQGLIPFLADQHSLELVFLNGCSTELQVQELIDRGINISIGTSREIDDAIACKLAIRFYKGLGEGQGIKKSWEDAIYELKTGKGDHPRASLLRHGATASSQFPWKLLNRPGSEDALEWSLPFATNSPLFGLPAIPEHYELPDDPYRYLDRFTREDARVFFGRDLAIRRLYNLLTDKESSPVILFFGQSGVGKSSLLEAGLYPRLELTHEILYVRRNKEKGVTQTLFAEIEKRFGKSLSTQEDLGTFWKLREATTDKPLIIIMDQVEEIFTRPNNNLINELTAFLEIIGKIFKVVNNRPKGKLIISYRKEYHLEIFNTIRANRISSIPFSLSRFNKNEIISIVNGLQSTSAHESKYQLTSDDELPAIIANDLLKDKDTPIAPVLQIILTKLWKNEESLYYQKATIRKHFSVDHYNEQLEKGIILDDFFYQQIDKLKNWKEGPGLSILESGLALDILDYHTTDNGSAESRSDEEVHNKYEHWKHSFSAILNQLKELYLLTTTFDNKNTALAHDTLAPIIQKAIKESDKPGQRAKRILEAKVAEFRLNAYTTIDPQDLTIVEKGKMGMRQWTIEENEVIENSRENKKRIEQKRKRNLSLIALLILGIVSVLLGGGWNYNKQAKINFSASEAANLKNIDPTGAMKKIAHVLRAAPTNTFALQTRNEIFEQNEFYFNTIKFDKPIIASVLISGTDDFLIALSDEIILYNKSNQPKATFTCSCNAEIISLSISPNNKYLAAGYSDNHLRLWNLNGNSKPQIIEGHSQHIKDVVFSKNSKYILTAGADSLALLWDLNGELISKLEGHSAEVSAVDFSPTGDTLITGSYDGGIALWHRDGRVIVGMSIFQDWVTHVQYSTDGQNFVSALRDGTAQLWSKNLNSMTELMGHNKRVNKAIFLSTEKLILTVSDDNTIRLWNMNGNMLKTYKGHREEVIDIAHKKNEFLTVGRDSSVKFWRIRSKVVTDFKAHRRAIMDLVVSFKKDQIITAESGGLKERGNKLNLDRFNFDVESKPGLIKIWNAKNYQLIDSIEVHTAGINDIELSATGNLLASASDDSTAIIKNLNHKDTIPLKGHIAQVNSISIAPNEEFFVTGSSDNKAYIWNVKGEIIDSILHTTGINSTAISPDGHTIIVGCTDGSIILRDFPGNKLRTIKAHDAGIQKIKFDPTGHCFLTAYADNTAKLWKSSGQKIRAYTFKEKNNTGGVAINDICFSSDGQLILFALEGKVVKMLNQEGQIIQTLNDFDGQSIHSVAFDATEENIIVGTADGKVRIFNNLAASNYSFLEK